MAVRDSPTTATGQAAPGDVAKFFAIAFNVPRRDVGQRSALSLSWPCAHRLVHDAPLFLPGRRRVLLYSIQNLKRWRPAWFREDVAVLLDLLRQKEIKPIIAEQMPLSDAKRAHELLGRGSLSGKIVLRCN